MFLCVQSRQKTKFIATCSKFTFGYLVLRSSVTTVTLLRFKNEEWCKQNDRGKRKNYLQ